MTEPEQKPRGRPKKYSGKRPNWTFRLEEKYGEQVRHIAEQSGRSISEVCEQLVVDSFRLQIVCDLLEKKIEALTEDLHACQMTLVVEHSQFLEVEKSALDLTHRMELMMRARPAKYRFGRPVREKSK